MNGKIVYSWYKQFTINIFTIWAEFWLSKFLSVLLAGTKGAASATVAKQFGHTPTKR